MKSGYGARAVKVSEGDKSVSSLRGVVIGMHRGGARASFTVRKVSFGQGSSASFRSIRPSSRRSR